MAEYLAWLQTRFETIRTKLRDDGSFFLNLDGDGWTPFQVAGVLQPLFRLQNRIEWVKSLVIPERHCPHCTRPIPSRQIGHFRSLGGDISLNRCGEFLLHLTKHRDVRLDRQTIGIAPIHRGRMSYGTVLGSIVREISGSFRITPHGRGGTSLPVSGGACQALHIAAWIAEARPRGAGSVHGARFVHAGSGGDQRGIRAERARDRSRDQPGVLPEGSRVHSGRQLGRPLYQWSLRSQERQCQ